MKAVARTVRIGISSFGVLLIPCALALAGSHTWDVNEVFSNADGTIQFIELKECCGGIGETGVNGHNVTSSTKSFTIPAPALAQPTSFRHLLFATPAFAALPGAPTPDHVFPAGSVPFFSTNGDTLQYTPWDTFVFGVGALPTNGVSSLNPDLTTGCNSPTNYAGQTGSVNVGCSLLGDVDGSGSVNGDDIAAFVRAKLGNPIVGDQEACAEYCTGTLAADVAAFVTDLMS